MRRLPVFRPLLPLTASFLTFAPPRISRSFNTQSPKHIKITNNNPTFVVVIPSVDVVAPFAFLLPQFDLLDVPFISRLLVVQSLDYFRLFSY